MWPLTFGLQSTKQTNAQASAWFLRSAWNIICLAICDILPWSKTFHRCKTYISFSLYNRAFGWEPIGYKTVLGCKFILHSNRPSGWVSVCQQPWCGFPLEDQIEGQENTQYKKIQPDVSFLNMEHHVIAAAATVVITEHISSVRVQDEIKVDSSLLQHNARGFWSEAFHWCHNCKKHGQQCHSCMDAQRKRSSIFWTMGFVSLELYITMSCQLGLSN